MSQYVNRRERRDCSESSGTNEGCSVPCKDGITTYDSATFKMSGTYDFYLKPIDWSCLVAVTGMVEVLATVTAAARVIETVEEVAI